MHRVLSIRMKAEQFTARSRVEIWFSSRPAENFAQPESWKFNWNFDISRRWVNSKQFQKIFYFGNKYLTIIICLVWRCDIACRWEMVTQTMEHKNWEFQDSNICISAVECMSSTLVSQFHTKKAFTSEWSHWTHSGYPKQHQCCHGSRLKSTRSWKKNCVIRTFCS